MKSESDLDACVESLEQDESVSDDRLQSLKEQLRGTRLQKQNTLKRIQSLEDEVKRKRKEMGATQSWSKVEKRNKYLSDTNSLLSQDFQQTVYLTLGRRVHSSEF